MRLEKVEEGGEEKDLTQRERQISTGSCLRREYGSWVEEGSRDSGFGLGREEIGLRKVLQFKCSAIFLSGMERCVSLLISLSIRRRTRERLFFFFF